MKQKNNSLELNFLKFKKISQVLIIISVALVLLSFSTFNTTSFIVIKSFLLKFTTFLILTWHILVFGFQYRKINTFFAIFCFFLSLFLSIFSLSKPLIGILRLSEYLSYFLILILTYIYFDTKEDIKKLVNYIIYLSFPIIIYGIFQYFGIDFSFWEKPEGRMDLFSTLGNVNWFGLYLAGIIPLLLFNYYNEFNWNFKKIIYFIFTTLAIGLLVITYSRTAILAEIIAFIIGFFIYTFYIKSFNKKYFFQLIIWITIFCVFAFIFSFRNVLSQNRFSEGGFYNRIKAGFSLSEQNVAQRLFIWKITLNMFLDKPIFGLGLGSFKVNYLDYQKDFFKKTNNIDEFERLAGNAKEAHNDYVQMLAECGIVGFITMIYFFYTIFLVAFKYLKNENNKVYINLTIVLMISLLAYLIGALADFPFHVPANAMMIFLICGIILSISSNESFSSKSTIINNKNENLNYTFKFSVLTFIGIITIFLVILPYIADYFTFIGQNYLKIHDFENAISWLKKAISLNPAQGDALYLLGTAYVGLATKINENDQKYDELITNGYDLLLKSKSYTIDKGIYNNLGFIAIRQKKWDLAIEYFEKAIGCDPKSADSLNNIGIVYFHKQNYDKALYYYEKAIKFNPYFLIAINNLGDLYTKNKQYEKAIEFYSKVINLTDEIIISENVRRNVFNFNEITIKNEKSRSYYQIGEIYRELNNYKEALFYYQKSYELLQTLPQIPLKIAMMNYLLNNYNDAIYYAQIVIQTTHPNSEFHKKANEILLKLKK